MSAAREAEADLHESLVRDSFRAQIAALKPEQTFALAERIPGAQIINLNAIKERLLNKVRAPIARAKRDTGHDYTFETAEALIGQGFVLVTVAVTRVA